MGKVDWVWVAIVAFVGFAWLFSGKPNGGPTEKLTVEQQSALIVRAEAFNTIVYEVEIDGVKYLVNSQGGIIRK